MSLAATLLDRFPYQPFAVHTSGTESTCFSDCPFPSYDTQKVTVGLRSIGYMRMIGETEDQCDLETKELSCCDLSGPGSSHTPVLSFGCESLREHIRFKARPLHFHQPVTLFSFHLNAQYGNEKRTPHNRRLLSVTEK